MKNIKIILLLSLIIQSSCTVEDLSTNNYTFYNSTDYELNIVAHEKLSLGNTDFSYKINPNESISFQLSDFSGLFDFIPKEHTDRVIAYKFNSTKDFHYTIIDYEYQIKYVVSGSTKSALITYNGSTGSIGQTTRNLPYTIGIKNFKDDFVYLSAQSEDGYGNVKVEIFVEDKLKYSSQAGGFNIAEVSGPWINPYN